MAFIRILTSLVVWNIAERAAVEVKKKKTKKKCLLNNYLADLMSTVFEDYHLQNSPILILVLFSFTLIYCPWLKRKIFLVLVFHFDFPADTFFSFERVVYKLHREFFALSVFPGRGTCTPLFCLDGYAPLSSAWFPGSWTGILYKNVKVGYKLSTSVVPSFFYQKIQLHDVN